MGRATVVIGANYGDEGKGHIVDFLTAELPDRKVVVRFNGGAQAGHTVLTPDGRHHIFSHFGSGALAGASTYLAKHFVCNPILFWKEARELVDRHGIGPIVAADPRCFVTTPYDILVNQAAEDARGKQRHGSVGVGFGETIERSGYPIFRLLKSDLDDRDAVISKLRLIRDRWLPERLGQLGLPGTAKDDPRLSEDMLARTVTAFDAFGKTVHTAGAEFIENKSVIFEGAQGLSLDMGSVNFPHVTRSNTGLTNVLPLARAVGLSLDVIYVSRTYLTKHGAGPLPGECLPAPEMVDLTNTPHPYQGTLRFAPLDVPGMLERIEEDAAQLPGASWSVALTCVDQVSSTMASAITRGIGDVTLISSGPDRKDIQRLR